ncbi:MAG TPA: hypothetical protein VNZ86_15010, partial [Bacteroidia bacterium]|nr:hypothetical protein [Bacteroidia bacterium]
MKHLLLLVSAFCFIFPFAHAQNASKSGSVIKVNKGAPDVNDRIPSYALIGIRKDLNRIGKDTIVSKKIKSAEAIVRNGAGKKEYKVYKLIYTPTGELTADSACDWARYNDNLEYESKHYLGYAKGTSTRYQYDPKGHLLASCFSYYINSSDQESLIRNERKKIYCYNARGQCVQELEFSNGMSFDTLMILLNASSNVMATVNTMPGKYDRTGSASGLTHEYDAKGNELKTTTFSTVDMKRK